MGEYTYVDYSNLFVEAQRLSAKENNMASSIAQAMSAGILDTSYRLAFDALYRHLAGVRPKAAKRTAVFGSTDEQVDFIWCYAQRAGFETRIFPRNASNKEKQVDTALLTELLRDAYVIAEKTDIFRIIGGDGDYVPAVERLVEDGFHVEVHFWSHASIDLKNACTAFRCLDSHLRVFQVR